jgi:hypothetical protein
MIMRFQPANIRLINRRSTLPRLLLALSSGNDNYKSNPTDLAELTRSLHIRPNRSLTESWAGCRLLFLNPEIAQNLGYFWLGGDSPLNLM